MKIPQTDRSESRSASRNRPRTTGSHGLTNSTGIQASRSKMSADRHRALPGPLILSADDDACTLATFQDCGCCFRPSGHRINSAAPRLPAHRSFRSDGGPSVLRLAITKFQPLDLTVTSTRKRARAIDHHLAVAALALQI